MALSKKIESVTIQEAVVKKEDNEDDDNMNMEARLDSVCKQIEALTQIIK